MAQQTPISLTGPNGERLQIGVGGYLRPVYLLRRDGKRLVVAATLGWIDTRCDASLEDQALALTGYFAEPVGRYQLPDGDVIEVELNSGLSMNFLMRRGDVVHYFSQTKIAQALLDRGATKLAKPTAWTRTWFKPGDAERDEFGRCSLCGADMNAFPYQQADHWLGEHYVDWQTFEVGSQGEVAIV